ncbi:hypothetical protein LUZ63_023972 [Rhynchospora breviuscula]|uniref:Uncharacterized protein n=1 Tax=Rhynchospora breviuscula TaxID=2022672 RepID=A0A9Q0BXK9_9POAL|nr:hypothetical protein LUZ63_023972 [Rhynchospora breviuscula]
MRRLFLSLFHKQIFPSTPITSFFFIPFVYRRYALNDSASCLPKILLLQLLGHRVIQISCVFFAFPMLQLMYQFDRYGMDRFNILLGSLVLTLLCGIHSCLALGITSSSGWNSSQNFTTLPTLLPLTLSCTSIETEENVEPG